MLQDYTLKCLSSSFVLFLFFSATPVQKGKFIIKVEGLRNSDGVVTVALYEEDGHLSEDKVWAEFHSSISGQKSTIVTDEIPFGEYSMVVIHDENNNGKMDFNLVKMPKEGLGFSKNPKIGLSKPSFEDTKVNLNSNKRNLTIRVKYF